MINIRLDNIFGDVDARARLAKMHRWIFFPLATACLHGIVADAAFAQSQPTVPKPQSAEAVRTARLAKQQLDWHKALANAPLAGPGCYRTEFPDTELRKVACVTPPAIPFPPRRGPLPDTVGNGYDYSARVTGNLISVTGSFPVAITTGESGFTAQSPSTPVADAYSLQINSSFFKSSRCNGATNPANCLAWQQYVYSSKSNASAFMQYWLINYGPTCPSGWASYSGSCFRNSPSVSVSPIPATSLGQTTFTGSVAKGGNDRLDLAAGATHYVVTSPDSVVNLADNWTTAEFTLVGDCCGYAANFNAGTTLSVTTTTHNGQKTAPACLLVGYTGETNNLNLLNTPPLPTQAAPTLRSDQGSTPVGLASCATASGLGDTHLHTFTPTAAPPNAPATNLSYDFQAEGDFILALTKSGFQVQNRQVSGGEQWPGTAINKAIGATIGHLVVVFDLETGTPRVTVDGAPISLNHGEKRVLGSDGDIRRSGNSYAVRDMEGNSVQVTFTAKYIDVFVGLGMWPTNVVGLLVNARDNVNAVASRSGQVFAQPFTLPSFYSGYGDSWRVRPGQSLFDRVLTTKEVIRRNPLKPYYATDLPRPVYEMARRQCTAAGVKPARLDDCTLDVAVLGEEASTSHLSDRTIASPTPARIRPTAARRKGRR